MPGEGLKRSVLERAQGEVEGLLLAAEEEVRKALAESEERAEKAWHAAVEKARREAREARERALSAAERETGLALLGEKNRLLEEAFARAGAAFQALSHSQQAAQAGKELHGLDLAGAVVRVPKGAATAFASALGKDFPSVGVEEDPSLAAGYLVEAPEFRLDRTLAARLREAREELRTELSALLFGEGH